MKTYRFLTSCFVLLFISAGLSAQTADDVISKYISAIGGKENLSKITSLQMKSRMVSDMFEAEATTTVLNGKGFKTAMDVMGYQSITCYTDEGGWRTNPMEGTTDLIPEDEFKFEKGQIYVGGLWGRYKEIGLHAELVGRAEVDGVNTFQIRITMDGVDRSSDHFFDPDTYLLIRSTATMEAQGMQFEMINTYQDYREVEGGIKLPHVQKISYAGQMNMENTLSSVEVNLPVDPAIFISE